MKETWQSNVIPKECIKFRLDKNEQGTKINGVTIKSIPDAQKLVEEPLKSIWRDSNEQ